MADFTPKPLNPESINKGVYYKNGDTPHPNDFNSLVEGILDNTEKTEENAMHSVAIERQLDKKANKKDTGSINLTVVDENDYPLSHLHLDYRSAFLRGNIDTVIQGRSMNKYFQKLDDLYGSYVKFLTEEKTAYSRDIPANSLPNVMIDKIGGVTHKCKNLIHIDKIEVGSADKIYNCNIIKPIWVKAYSYTAQVPRPLWRIQFRLQDGTDISIRDEALQKGYQITGVTAQNPIIRIATRSVEMTSGYIDDIMINYGEPLPYEPYYSGLYNATPTAMKINGANLFDTDNYYGDDTSFIKNGVYSYNKETHELTQLRDDYYGVIDISFAVEINSRYIYLGSDVRRVVIYDFNTKQRIYDDYDYRKNTKMDLGYVVKKIGIFFPPLAPDSEYPYYMGRLTIATKPITWEYTPYTPPQTIDLAQLSTLKGFGRGIETDGKVYTNGFDFKTKGYNYQVDEIDLGDLTYKKGGHDNKRWITGGIMQEIQKPNPDKLPVIIADSYNVVAFSNQTNEKDIAINPLGEIFITDTQYTTPDELKQALKGVKLQYLIATPEITEHPEIDIPDMFRAEQNGSVEFINPKKKAVYSQLTFEIKNV